MIAVKRAYESASSADGTRFLVERLWPRAVPKAKLRIEAWLKDVAATTELRQWFGQVRRPMRAVAADRARRSAR